MKLQNSITKPSIISHRGNLEGANPYKENHPDTLEAALKKGFGIEFDVWFVDGQWALGHDAPQYAVTFSYLLGLGRSGRAGEYDNYHEAPRAWMHLKNLPAVQEMRSINHYASCVPSDGMGTTQLAKRINYFWHQEDDITITNHGHVWTHPKVATIPYGSAWVVPEVKPRVAGIYDYENPNWTRASWVCVDYPIAVSASYEDIRRKSVGGYFAT